MTVIIGSARHDEKGGYVNGAKGDSLQTSVPDRRGEVSMQNFYVHSKGWNVIRAKSKESALKIAQKMKDACNNRNLGYSQSDRYGVIRDGISTRYPSNCDCSSLVRACVKEATGIDPGDFTTSSAVTRLEATGLFTHTPYTSGMMLFTGDILCTRSKGHIVIVTDGEESDLMPKTGNPYKEPTKNVKYGHKGNDVRWVQYALNEHGYKLIVDGIFKEKTRAAVVDFQHKAFPDQPEEHDGIVGVKTRDKLKTISFP